MITYVMQKGSPKRLPFFYVLWYDISNYVLGVLCPDAGGGVMVDPDKVYLMTKAALFEEKEQKNALKTV